MLEHQNAQGGWSTVASGLSHREYTFTSGSRESEGTWMYRVIESNETATAAPSSASETIKVDRTAPNTPTATASRPPDFAPGGGWYKDGVTVSFSANGDPILADGSSPSGVDGGSLSVPQTFTSSGTHTASGTVADLVGNVSSAATLTVQVDATPPSLEVHCPATALVGRTGIIATVTASDGESGLASDPSGTVPINTAQGGAVTTTRTAIDNVGHETTVSCTTHVEAPPEFGRCVNVPVEEEGGHKVYRGYFSKAGCTAELPGAGKYEWYSGAPGTGFAIQSSSAALSNGRRRSGLMHRPARDGDGGQLESRHERAGHIHRLRTLRQKMHIDGASERGNRK